MRPENVVPSRSPCPTALVVAASWLFAVSPLGAQIEVTEGPLPPTLLEEVADLLNAPDALRLTGGARVPSGTAIEGDLTVLGGSVQIAGTVTGALVVVNGDVRFSPGARVEGPLLVVGGALDGEEGAGLLGPVRVYSRSFRYRVRGGIIEPLPDEALAEGILSTDLGFGEARLGLRAAAAYNRAEGLPVHVGPVIATGGSNPLTLEAFAIWRSVSGLHLRSDELGYWFRLRQAVGGTGSVHLGAEAYDDTRAIESQGLSDLEASFSTFFLRRDPRDYYDRHGWSAFLDVRLGRLPVQATLSYSYEEHGTPPIRSPWALREGETDWRPMALVAEGPIRSLEAALLWNSRDDPVQPSDGWWLSLGVRRQVGGELRRPAAAPGDGSGEPPLVRGEPLRFHTRGSIDLRRYARVDPSTRLMLRAAAVGNLTSGPLPPQFQNALGGEGSLPGHRRFAIDCGARSSPWTTTAPGDPNARRQVFPAYGCDRTVLFQAELRGYLPISWNPIPESWEETELATLMDLRPVWSVFLDAGQGWARGSLGSGVERTDGPTRADVGVGLFMGPLGLYWSYPLNRRERGVNFFVRLDQRF